MSGGGKKPKGEVHEVINALEVLSAQNGQRPDVVQNKRDCFQVGWRCLQQARRRAAQGSSTKAARLVL